MVSGSTMTSHGRAAGLDDEATFNDVRAMAGGLLEHSTQIDLVEASVFHPLQEMSAQLKFPGPPLRPLRLSLSQDASESVNPHAPVLPTASASPAAPHDHTGAVGCEAV